jgi:hypothetical protein
VQLQAYGSPGTQVDAWPDFEQAVSMVVARRIRTAIARILARASAASVAEIDMVALFSGIGLLLSLSVLVLDQNIRGEWF